MSLMTALFALVPLAIRARLQEKAAAPDDELVSARIRIAELEAEAEGLRARLAAARRDRLDPQRLAALAQYQRLQNAAAQQAANALQQAQNAIGTQFDWAAFCECTPRHGRAGYLIGNPML